MLATTTTCFRCGATVAASQRFCPSCGAPQRLDLADAFADASDTTGDPLAEQLRSATLGAYEIRERLGQGGMAAVYLAHDLRLDRKVAVKVMLPELALVPGMPERFTREAQTAAKLYHPNIIVIHSVERVRGLHFFVMSLVDGLPLDQVLRRAGVPPIAVVQALVAQVARALHFAHTERVVHRDVKPSNIMVNRKGDAVVTDFGIAKAAASPTLTQTGTIVGTPAYMSPEQCLGGEITAASDQYSLGIVAYQMLAGQPPFTGPALEIQWAHMKTEPRPIIDVQPECPPALADAVMRMLRKNPADRWPTLIDAVPAVVSGLSISEDAARQHLAELLTSGATPLPVIHGQTPVSPLPRRDLEPPPARDAGPHGAATVAAKRPVLSLTSPRDTLRVGETMQLVAAHVSGPTPAPDAAVRWSTSDPRTLQIDAEGVATGIAPGRAIVTVRRAGAVAGCALEVQPALVTRLAVWPLAMTVGEGETGQIAVELFDAAGKPLEHRPLRWESSDPSTVTLDSDGTVHGHTPGRAIVTVRCDAAEATVDVEVRPAVVAVFIDSGDFKIDDGDERRLAAIGIDAAGGVIPDASIEWTSDAPSVVTVRGGVVSAVSPGTATIVARAMSASASLTVTVTPAPVARIDLSPGRQKVRAGRSVRLRAAVVDTKGRVVTDRVVRWSSAEADVASVDASGRVSGKRAGVVAVRASVDDIAGETVIQVLARRIFISPPWRRRGSIGLATIATAGIVLWAGVRAIGGLGSPGSTSGPSDSAASTSPAPRVSANTPSTQPPTKTTTQPATRPATQPATTALVVILGVPAVTTVGNTVTAIAEVRDRQRAVLTNRIVRWRSTAPGVASVDSMTGRVTANSTGQTTIVAEVDGVTRRTPLKVSAPAVAQASPPPAPPSLIITSVDRSIHVGESIILVARKSGGTASPSSIAWRVDPPAVAEVDADGRVTGRADGTATITARWQGASASARVTVRPVPVSTIAIVAPSSRLVEGEQMKLEAVTRDAQNKLLTGRAVAWKSDDERIATIDNAGLLIARSAGTTGVVATSEDQTARVVLSVSAKPVVATPAPNPAVNAPANSQPNPPAGAPAPDRAALDRAIDASVADFVKALNARNSAGVRALVEDASWRQLDKKIATLDASELRKGRVAPSEPQPTAEFSVRLRWKNNVGRGKDAVASFRATFAQRGGSWALQSIRLLTSLD
jgi:uncharacterized protein YjdB